MTTTADAVMTCVVSKICQFW